MSIIDVGADLADAGFGPDAGVVSGAATPFIVEDDYLDLGGKYFDVGPLAGRDDLPDGGTVDEIEVPGVPRDVEVPEADTGTGHDYTGSSGGGNGDPSSEDEICPSEEFYRDTAQAVGLLANVLGALKDSPFTVDPRDDRAIERALIGIDSLEIALQSGGIDYSTALEGVAGAISLVLSEGTDYLAGVLGAMAGGFVAGLFDGPLPFGEIIGGITAGVGVYLAGDRLPHIEVARMIARLVLANVSIPADTPGPCGND